MSEAVAKRGNGNIVKIAILIVLLLILIGGAGFGGYFFAVKTNAAHTSSQQTEVVEVKPADETTVVMDEFLLNLADESSVHVIKTKVALAYDTKNKKIVKELESKKVQIRDAIGSVLSSKKSAEFTPKGKEDVKKEILTRVNSLLTTGKLSSIYYNDIFVQ